MILYLTAYDYYYFYYDDGDDGDDDDGGGCDSDVIKMILEYSAVICQTLHGTPKEPVYQSTPTLYIT